MSPNENPGLIFNDQLCAFILRAELGALLHDFGKLSSIYLARESYEGTDEYAGYKENRIFHPELQCKGNPGGKGTNANGKIWDTTELENLRDDLKRFEIC